MERALARSLELTRFDQMTAEMAAAAVFVGYREASISFAPTYRMVKGSVDYSNKKNQNPSYCDRVLHRAAPGFPAARSLQLGYDGGDGVISKSCL